MAYGDKEGRGIKACLHDTVEKVTPKIVFLGISATPRSGSKASLVMIRLPSLAQKEEMGFCLCLH